jgi:hypothetical protein
MHVPHATNFYGKFENLNFDIFCKNRLFQIKMAITFAYGLEKKRIIYKKNYLHKILHLISTAYGRLHNFLFLKIPKGNMKAGRF